MRAVILAILMMVGAQAQAACRHALILALDISGSVDAVEYKLQLNGIATALRDPEIQDVILQLPGNNIELLVFDWNGPGKQRILVDWTELVDEEVLEQVASTLLNRPKVGGIRQTALGEAIQYARRLMFEKPHCARKTIDISGDGINNAGPDPWEVYLEMDLTDVTVNALAVGQPDEPILTEEGESYSPGALFRYFERKVIRGPDAFAEHAEGYRDYANAIKRKLIRELAPLHLSGLPYEEISRRLAAISTRPRALN